MKKFILALVVGCGFICSQVWVAPTKASASCPTDFNNDTEINLLDYSYFVQYFKSKNAEVDLNQDQKINLIDYSYFVQSYFEGCPKIEPATSTIWDNGLSKRCVVTAETPTAQAGGQPLYQDLSQCLNDDPVFGQSRWQLGFQAESGYGSTANCQSFPAINEINSPLGFNWLDQGDGTLTGHMTLDLLSHSHPCAGNHFNWYVFMNQATSTATLPRIDMLTTSHTLFYKTIKQNGASRLIATLGGFVKTSDTSNPEMFSIEVALNLDDWGDNFPDNPVISKCDLATCGSHHVFIDGDHFGLHIDPEQEEAITIPWYTIYSFLVTHNHLPAPKEYSNAYLSTGNIGIGFEVNNFTQNDSYFAELFQADFNIISL